MTVKKAIPYSKDRLPKHVAIIMDGNGRWANKRMLPRQIGDKAGIEALKRTIEAVIDLGIPVLTVYAFSTENWKRPDTEINYLMTLLHEYLSSELLSLHEQNIKLRIIGDGVAFSARIQEELTMACEMTTNNTALLLNIALNYGGRMEITTAARNIAEKVLREELRLEDINEDIFAQQLFTEGVPDPDLLIRTAGDMRVSNFLLWQIAYSEIWITDVLWPDFNGDILAQAIEDYGKRDRKFGGALEQ